MKSFISTISVAAVIYSLAAVMPVQAQLPAQQMQIKKPMQVMQGKPKQSGQNQGSSSNTLVGPNSHDMFVVVKGITTDGNGRLKELSVRYQNRVWFIKGCDAKLADLPHLLMAFDKGHALYLSTGPDSCLSKVWTVKR